MGLHCLPNCHFRGSSIQRVGSPLSDEFNHGMPHGPKVARPVGRMFYIDILYKENIKNLV